MIKTIKNCFDPNPINTSRQQELDIAKGFIIIFMVLSHAIEVLGWFFEPQAADGFIWHGFDMIIKGSAPIFMFCMGISLSYSQKQSAKDTLRRALGTAGIVLLLEFARTVIPCFLEWLIFRDPESMVYASEIVCVDILQFATMVLFAFALLKKLKIGTISMLVIAVVCSVLGQLLQGVSTGSLAGDMAAGFIWNTYYASFFPFLNWFIVPVIGYAFGKIWLHMKDKDNFFKLVTPISLAITIIYYASMLIVGEWYYFSCGNYCGIGILDVLFMFVIFFLVVGGCYYLSKISSRAANYFESMGTRITSIFCIHWTIYCFLYLGILCVVGENYVPLWTVVPVAALVFFASDLLSRLYKKHQRKKKDQSIIT